MTAPNDHPPQTDYQHKTEWEVDCLKFRGVVLRGKYAHWCVDWDSLPMDETCSEWPCACADDLKKDRL